MRAEAWERFRNDPRYREPNWVGMYERLLAILPKAAETLFFRGYLEPDGILKAAMAEGVPYYSFFIYNPWRLKSDGYGDKRWEDYDDTEVLDLLREQYPLPSGPLWFLPWQCHGDNQPYLLQGSELRHFILERDCDMCDDAVLIACDSPWVTLIHHDGVFFHFTVSEKR